MTLRPPFAVLAARPSRKEGWEVLEALGFAGKHLETTSLEAVKDTEELAVGRELPSGGGPGGVTFIAGRRLIRRLLERPRGLEPKVLAAFPFSTVVVARAWERGYGYAVYERGEKVRERVYALGEILVDVGELLEEEEDLYGDAPEYDPEGEPLEDEGAVERGCAIAARLLARVHPGPLRGIEMELYEGPA